MKTRKILISAISAAAFTVIVLFMFSFINRETIQYKAVVAMDKIHIVYLNFDNPVTVIVPGVPKEKVVVKCPEVAVKSLGDSKYSIPVMDPLLSNKKIHLSVYVLNTAGKEQLVQTLEYLVICAPEPLPYFVNKSGGKLKPEELTSDSLYVEIPGFYYEGFRYKVSKFFMVYLDSAGIGMTFPQDNGFMLNPNQKNALNNLHKGDKIIFSEIWSTYTDPISKKPNNEIRIPKNMEFVIE